MRRISFKIKLKKGQNINKIERDDEKISLFICLYSVLGIVNIAIKMIFPITDSAWGAISNFFTIILVLFLLRALPAIINRRFMPLILMEVVILCVYLISFVYGLADNKLLVSNLFTSTCIVVPIGVAALSVKDHEVLYHNIIKYSYIVFLISLVCVVTSLGKTYDQAYSMSLSNYMLVFILAQWNEVFLRSYKKWLHVLCALYGIGFILFFGNRAALVSIIVFIFIKIIKNDQKPSQKILFIVAIMALVGIVSRSFVKLVTATAEGLNEIGRFSYIIRHLVSGNFFESDARIDLFSYYFQLVKQRPIIGWGVYGGYIGSGTGPHNIILEALLAFGIFVGGLLSLFLIISFAKVFLERKKDNSSSLKLIFAAAVVMKLVSGGGLFTTPNLMIFMLLVWDRKKDASVVGNVALISESNGNHYVNNS